MLILFAALACWSPAPLEGKVLTDGGTWRLSLDETTYDQGVATLGVKAWDTESGDLASDLILSIHGAMEEMGHTTETTELSPEGDGLYSGELTFGMSGIWTLEGEASEQSEGEIETFTFTVEVLP